VKGVQKMTKSIEIKSMEVQGMSRFEDLIKKQLLGKFGIILGLVALMAVFGSQSSVFLSMGNLQNILIQSAVNAVIAAGMTFVIISGDIDLSVGSILALSSVVGAAVMVVT
jgi:ribose transport system permease protein